MTEREKIIAINKRATKLMEETYEKVRRVKLHLDTLIASGMHENLRDYRIVGEVVADLEFDYESYSYEAIYGDLNEYVASEWNVTATYGQELLGKEHFFHADKNFNKDTFSNFREKICEVTYGFLYSKNKRRTARTVYKISIDELVKIAVGEMHSDVYVIWGELIDVNFNLADRDRIRYKRHRRKAVPHRYRQTADERIVALQKRFVELEYGYDYVTEEIADTFSALRSSSKKLFGNVELSRSFLYHKRRCSGKKTRRDRELEFNIADEIAGVMAFDGFSFTELDDLRFYDEFNGVEYFWRNRKIQKKPVRITIEKGLEGDIATWCEPFYLLDPPFNKYYCTLKFHGLMDHIGLSYADVVCLDAEDFQPYWIVKV